MPDTTAMELTFIGHQSWLIGSGSTHVLVDPVLKDGFGHCADLQFSVWPPRHVDVPGMPSIDAVVLSHEHLDHLHFPSLAELPTNTLVLTGTLTPAPVTDAIERLGLRVERMDAGSTRVVGELEISLYPAGAGTIFWEKRVSQIVVRRFDGGSDDVFIPVDALLSEMYLDDIESGVREAPRLVIAANNSQVVPHGALGAYTNLLPLGTRARSDMSGVEILQAVVLDYLQPLPGVAEVALCGNGFISPRTEHGPFLYADHRRLATLANELQQERVVFGPRPGERLVLARGSATRIESVAWIAIDAEFERAALAQHEAFLCNPVAATIAPLAAPFAHDAEARAAQSMVEAELPHLARALMGTEVGELAVSLHEHLRGVLGSGRMLLCLREGPGGETLFYAWDAAATDFVVVTTTESDGLEEYPFGLVAYLADFAAVVAGERQIWDLAGTAMQSWYVGDTYSTMITALYKLYGEQFRPDLAAKVYARAIESLPVAVGVGDK